MSEKSTPANDIAQLIQLGREQGYLTHSDITDTLPDGSTDEDNFEEIIQVLGDMGIKVFENTPDQDELMLGEDEETDELAAEDAVAALSQTEIESGRTTDPVRMYMREMGSVDLLTKTGEIDIAKRIEASILFAISISPVFVRRSTLPISRIYILTGSVVLPDSISVCERAATASSAANSSVSSSSPSISSS